MLARQLVVVVDNVLRTQREHREQVQRAPAEPASPGLLAFLPVQLQRLVVEFEQRLAAQFGFTLGMTGSSG